MNDLQVQVINISSNDLPAYATSGSSGMDLRAWLEESIQLEPMQRQLVPTGIFLHIPSGFEAQVRPRSGLALKQGITCLNSPGTIDSDYRGEVKVLLINLGEIAQTILNGDRIAQLVFARTETAALLMVQQLSESVRGEGGFGHTGHK